MYLLGIGTGEGRSEMEIFIIHSFRLLNESGLRCGACSSLHLSLERNAISARSNLGDGWLAGQLAARLIMHAGYARHEHRLHHLPHPTADAADDICLSCLSIPSQAVPDKTRPRQHSPATTPRQPPSKSPLPSLYLITYLSTTTAQLYLTYYTRRSPLPPLGYARAPTTRAFDR
jgi:hypothetical protein